MRRRIHRYMRRRIHISLLLGGSESIGRLRYMRRRIHMRHLVLKNN
jgi:hypothetical protein